MSSLKPYVQSLPNQLAEEVTENGSNFSVGQRQLICMARALLKKPKILLMDEATASVDMETDKVIQGKSQSILKKVTRVLWPHLLSFGTYDSLPFVETIRKSFSDATLLVIAHRINTIIDMDRIMVLQDGKLVEFDTPGYLLSNPNGHFTKMVEATGDSSAAFLRSLVFKEDSDDLM